MAGVRRSRHLSGCFSRRRRGQRLFAKTATDGRGALAYDNSPNGAVKQPSVGRVSAAKP